MKVLVTFDFNDELMGKMRKALPDVKFEKRLEIESIKREIVDAEVLFAGVFNAEIFSKAERLRWVQSRWTGVNRYLFPEFTSSSVILTNERGIHPTPISDHVLGIMLVFSRKLNMFMQFQLQKKWQKLVGDKLEGKTVGIVGLGAIGNEVAKKAKCFGMRIIATKKSIGDKPPYVDELLPHTQLTHLLRESDFVVLSVPFTKETDHMIGEKELRLMKRNSILINISRGGIVDEKAITLALKERRIAGAGLDVFEKEPLPPDSELWSLENIVITPHASSWIPENNEMICERFIDNLKRFISGQPLRDVVDKQVGY